MICPVDDEVPVVRFSGMENFDPLVRRVNIVAIGEYVEIPPSDERYLQKLSKIAINSNKIPPRDLYAMRGCRHKFPSKL